MAHPSHSQGLQRGQEGVGAAGGPRHHGLPEGWGFTQGLRNPPYLIQGVRPCGLQVVLRHALEDQTREREDLYWKRAPPGKRIPSRAKRPPLSNTPPMDEKLRQVVMERQVGLLECRQRI